MVRRRIYICKDCALKALEKVEEMLKQHIDAVSKL